MHLPLSCQCGTIKGEALSITPQLGTRLICYCEDCQNFIRHLNQTEAVLDQNHGTEIYQLPIAQVKITQGKAQLRCLRLSEKGPIRWYAECCKTPIGNTVSADIPLIGLIHSFYQNAKPIENKAGPIRGYFFKKSAHKFNKIPLLATIRIITKVIGWRIKKLNRPNDFFTESGQPLSSPIRINIVKKTQTEQTQS